MKRTMIQRMGKSTAALLLAAVVSVGFLQGAMMQPVSAEAAELSDFEAVFDAYSTTKNAWDGLFGWSGIEKCTLSEKWATNEEGMLRAADGADGKLNLLYTKEKYTDFTMTFRYKMGSTSDLYLGIGAPESGAALGASGKLLDPSPTVLRIYKNGSYQYAPTSGGGDNWCGPGNLFKDDEAAQNAVHTVTISVTGSTMTMTVDGQSLNALALTNYEGGHIFFGAGWTSDAFSLPVIEDMALLEYKEMFDAYSTDNGVNSSVFGWKGVQASTLSDYWHVNTDGLLESKGGGKIQLLYTKESYTNFTMTFQYKHKADGNATDFLYLGVGAESVGDILGSQGDLANPSPTVIEIHRSGTNSYAPKSDGTMGTYKLDTGFTSDDQKAIHTVEVTVNDSQLTMTIDGKPLKLTTGVSNPEVLPLTNYEGGHIFFGGGMLGDAFSLPIIKETTPIHTPADEWSSDESGHWHICTVCGTKVDEAAHNPGAAATEDTPQTCTVCGYVLAPATGHVNHVADTSQWLHDDTQHWHKCQGCDEKMDVAAHSYGDWKIIHEATETEEGLKERTCSVCGKKESEEIPATGGQTPPVENTGLSDFEGMFDAYSTEHNVWDDFFNWPEPEAVAADDFTEYWTVNADGMLESTGGGKLNLLYTKEKYTDFTMTFRYKHGPDENNAAHLYVGIGAPESGATLGANGELLDPSPTLLRIYQAGNYQYAPDSNGKDSWYGPGNLFNDETAKNAVHTVTISVTGSTMTMTVDGQSLGALALTNYEGGHIFFGAGMTVDAIGLPEIEDTTPTNDFDGFSSYYTDRVGRDELTDAEPTDYWIEDEGAISRDAQTISGEEGQDWNETANHLNNMAYLFIKGEYTDYENYTVELDYTLGSGGWRRAYIGFGATDDVSWREENGGSVFFTDDGGNVCFEGNLVENGTVTKGWTGTKPEGFDAAESHHLKLTFQAGSITVEVDGQVVQTLENKAYYAGGRIFLASNSTGTKFENIQIKEIAAGENPGGGQTTPGGPDPDEGQEPDDDDESQTGEKNPNTGENTPIAAALLGLVAASAVIALKKRA